MSIADNKQPSYPGWVERRVKNNLVLITESETAKFEKEFAALMRRISKPKQNRYYRHAERLIILRQLLSLKPDAFTVDCMYACLNASSSTLERMWAILNGSGVHISTTQVSDTPESASPVSMTDVEQALSDIEYFSEE